MSRFRKPVAILGQQREVVAGLLHAAGLFRTPAPRGDVGLVADDRVDPRGFGGRVELQRPVQIAVVGQGQGVHPQCLGPLDQARRSDRPRPAGCSGCGNADGQRAACSSVPSRVDRSIVSLARVLKHQFHRRTANTIPSPRCAVSTNPPDSLASHALQRNDSLVVGAASVFQNTFLDRPVVRFTNRAEHFGDAGLQVEQILPLAGLERHLLTTRLDADRIDQAADANVEIFQQFR